MDEAEILKNLFDLDAKSLGVIGTIGIAVYSIYKKFKTILKILNLMWEQKAFETYNENLRFITQKTATYIFKTAFLKSNSQEIFETMKAIYDFQSTVNIDSKIIHFKMFELPDNSILFSNIVRFLDYYKSKNGILINIHLHEKSLNDTHNNLIADLKDYLDKSKIHGVKIISTKEENKK